MPPIARLTSAQAMYHFLSGYTAKVAGTEKGLVGVEPEFSTCFGAPFLPRHPSVYGNLLRELIGAHGVDCWLVNTGWTGGKYGVGRRMPIKVTRTLLTAALDGSLRNAKFRTDPYFGFAVPTQLAGVEPHLLYPHKTWQNKAEFDETARSLVAMFQKNFVPFESHVEADVRAAAPGGASRRRVANRRPCRAAAGGQCGGARGRGRRARNGSHRGVRGQPCRSQGRERRGAGRGSAPRAGGQGSAPGRRAPGQGARAARRGRGPWWSGAFAILPRRWRAYSYAPAAGFTRHGRP